MVAGVDVGHVGSGLQNEVVVFSPIHSLRRRVVEPAKIVLNVVAATGFLLEVGVKGSIGKKRKIFGGKYFFESDIFNNNAMKVHVISF